MNQDVQNWVNEMGDAVIDDKIDFYRGVNKMKKKVVKKKVVKKIVKKKVVKKKRAIPVVIESCELKKGVKK